MSSNPFAPRSCSPGSAGCAAPPHDTRPRVGASMRLFRVLTVTLLCPGLAAAGDLRSGDGESVATSRFELALSGSFARMSNGGPDGSAIQGELLLRPAPRSPESGALAAKTVSLSAQRAE